MIEANPANYVNLKLWGPQNAYANNDLVMFANGIYRANAAVTANQANPVVNTARWVFVEQLIEDEVASGDSFRKLRVNHNTTSLTMKAFLASIQTSGYMIWRGAFATSTQYMKGHMVKNGIWGNVYVAKADFTSAASFNGADWDLILDLTGITPVTEIRTASFTAVAGMRYFVNSMAGNVNITLPVAPTINTKPIWFTHIDGDVNTAGSNITFLRNGANIMGFPDDLQLDKNYASFMIAFSDAARGWRLTVL